MSGCLRTLPDTSRSKPDRKVQTGFPAQIALAWLPARFDAPAAALSFLIRVEARQAPLRFRDVILPSGSYVQAKRRPARTVPGSEVTLT